MSRTQEYAQGDAGSPDGERTEMKVDSTLTARQLSQVDGQENHLKPELISLSERERNFRYLLTSLDGMCHGRAKEKDCRWTANVISGKDEQCFFFKTATGQLLLRALLSLPSECKLLNSAANE